MIDPAHATFRMTVRSIALRRVCHIDRRGNGLGQYSARPLKGRHKTTVRIRRSITLRGRTAAPRDMTNPSRILDPDAAVRIIMVLCSVDSLIFSPLPGSLSPMTRQPRPNRDAWRRVFSTT
jgi:hypothetical protein